MQCDETTNSLYSNLNHELEKPDIEPCGWRFTVRINNYRVRDKGKKMIMFSCVDSRGSSIDKIKDTGKEMFFWQIVEKYYTWINMPMKHLKMTVSLITRSANRSRQATLPQF